MDTHILASYGTARTIRYLITSIDDLREAAETVRFIINQGCSRDDQESVMRSISISAMPLPKSLSSFIIGFDVPGKVLEAVSKSESIVPLRSDHVERAAKTSNSAAEVPGQLEISVTNNRSNFGFTVMSLIDLIEALGTTLKLLQSRSRRFEFINLKRRTRMKILTLEKPAKGIKLLFQVPGELQELHP